MSSSDLWVDFHRVDEDGFTHAHLDDAAPGRQIRAEQYIVVGDEDADPAVARVVSIDPDGVILLRVLPGHADAHRELLANQPA